MEGRTGVGRLRFYGAEEDIGQDWQLPLQVHQVAKPFGLVSLRRVLCMGVFLPAS
jgi:hypothetical protein